MIPHAWGGAEELRALLGSISVTHVVHLGWYADPSDYLTAAEPNLASLRNALDLVDVAAERGCRHLVVVGSSAEYGPSSAPHQEREPTQPWSVYGACKASLHLLLQSSWRPPSIGFAWARPFNLTGPGEHPARLVPTVVRSLLAGEMVALSPGEQVRDFLDVADVASALVGLSEADAEGTYNVCSGRGVTLRGLLTRLAQRAGDPELLRFGARGYGPTEPMVAVGSNRRLREAGWRPRHDLDGMLDRAVGYWRSHLAVEAPPALHP